MNWLREVQWSPYAVGIGIGVLSWLTWLISKKPIGCSTSFARSAGMIEKLFRGGQVEEKRVLPRSQADCRLAMDARRGHGRRRPDLLAAIR